MPKQRFAHFAASGVTWHRHTRQAATNPLPCEKSELHVAPQEAKLSRYLRVLAAQVDEQGCNLTRVGHTSYYH